MTHFNPAHTLFWSTDRRRLGLECAVVVLLTATAFVVRLWGMSRMHFWDENVYLQNAEYFCCGKHNYLEIDSRPPLLSLIFAGVFLFWNSDFAAWTVTSLLNALGPVFLYLAGRMIIGRIPAAIAALLLAFCPFFVGVFSDGNGGFVEDYSGHSLLTDCPALTLILLSFWLLLRAIQKQTDLRFACAGLSLALAVLMRFGSLSSVGILSLLVLVADRRVRAIVACGAGFVIGIAPYLCWSRLRYGAFLETFRNGWSNFGGPSEPFFYYMRNSVVMLSWLTLAGLALWFAQMAWDIRGARREQRKVVHTENLLGKHRRRWESFLWFWAVAVMVFFSSLSHKEPRYALPVVPPLLLLAGVGLSTLLRGRQIAVRAVGSIVLVCALLYNFWPVHHRFDTGFIDGSVSEEMTVSDFLKHNFAASTILYTNENYPDFAYYSDMTVTALPESGDELYESLKHLPDDGILIAYKGNDDNNNSAPSEPSLSWLDSSPHFRRFQEFPSMVLYKYHAF